jgi:hypothetical protein
MTVSQVPPKLRPAHLPRGRAASSSYRQGQLAPTEPSYTRIPALSGEGSGELQKQPTLFSSPPSPSFTEYSELFFVPLFPSLSSRQLAIDPPLRTPPLHGLPLSISWASPATPQLRPHPTPSSSSTPSGPSSPIPTPLLAVPLQISGFLFLHRPASPSLRI